MLHWTGFLIHRLCSPQMDEKWLIVSEEVRRPAAAVSQHPGANVLLQLGTAYSVKLFFPEQ